MMSTNSNRFHSSHLSTNPPDLFGKTWAHQNFTTSQDNSDFSIDLGKKTVKTYRLDQTCTTYLAAGIGCEMNRLVMELNPIQLLYLLSSDSRNKQHHSHGYPKYAPSAISLQSCKHVPLKGRVGRHAMRVIPRRFIPGGIHCNNQCRKGWM